jgi:phage terminase large subunit-like protein
VTRAAVQSRTDTVPIRPGVRGFYAFAAAVGLQLEPFQRRIVRMVLDGEPESLVLLSRGAGKSTLVGALAVHHLLTVPRAAVYVAAASREQARVVFEYARDFARHPSVAEHVVVRHLELRAADGGFLRVLASNAPKLHGLSPTMCVVDELHAHDSDEVYIALRTAMLKRPGARMVTISTAGFGDDSPLGRLRARARALPHITHRGALTAARGPGLQALMWEVPDDTEPTPAAAKTANPQTFTTVAQLAGQREALPDSAWRRFHCGQWVAREGAWLTAPEWDACVGDPAFHDGETIWAGLDVGRGERSTTALIWINAARHVGCRIYTTEDGILRARDAVRDLAQRYRLQALAFDPWNAQQLALEVEQDGVLAVVWPQSDARACPASARLHEAIRRGQLTLPDDPALRRQALAAVQRHSRRGWRIDRATRRPQDAVDGIVALMMALERADSAPAPARLVGWL